MEIALYCRWADDETMSMEAAAQLMRLHNHHNPIRYCLHRAFKPKRQISYTAQGFRVNTLIGLMEAAIKTGFHSHINLMAGGCFDALGGRAMSIISAGTVHQTRTPKRELRVKMLSVNRDQKSGTRMVCSIGSRFA
jgi:hypothetical protein